ncbi:MAG: type II toxin-antitoxin system RelE/ParE family toxin [Longicatena sp.]|nr:type II toxin-antitoxin system RelE/ParE family toxin [Longicatena sp.]
MFIKILYHDKKLEALCTDIRKAKQKFPQKIAEKLYALLTLIDSADCLNDINMMRRYHLHPLKGERDGQFAVDIDGRTSGYRLILVPLKNEDEYWCENDITVVYQSTKVLLILEVSNHYE